MEHQPFVPPPIKPIKLSSEKAIKESTIESNNKKYAKKKGVLFEKFQSANKVSVPDDVLTFENGLMVFIEYKRPGERASDNQFRDHQERRRRGVSVYVIDDQEAGEWLIDSLMALDKISSPHHRTSLIAGNLKINKEHYVSKKSITQLPS